MPTDLCSWVEQGLLHQSLCPGDRLLKPWVTPVMRKYSWRMVLRFAKSQFTLWPGLCKGPCSRDSLQPGYSDSANKQPCSLLLVSENSPGCEGRLQAYFPLQHAPYLAAARAAVRLSSLIVCATCLPFCVIFLCLRWWQFKKTKAVGT